MITKENAGDKLLQHRKDKRITQVEVSEKSGVSVQTISAIESGSLTPQTMTVYKINEYFKTLGKA